jgi:hypothetical protein
MAHSNQALAAQAIRKELKAMGIKASVKSKGYSMGDSVDVTLLNDPTPSVVAAVKDMTAKYQYGHFNGMEDIYEYSNCNDDLPQTKHLFVNVDYSDELRAKVKVFVSNYYSESCDLQSLEWQTLNGSAENGFWDATPVPADPTQITEKDLEELNAGFANPPKIRKVERDEWAAFLNAGGAF